MGDSIEAVCRAFALLDGVIRPNGAGPSGPRPFRPIVRASVTSPVRWTEWRRPGMSARGGVAHRDERNPVFEPPSETPCDPLPTAENGRAGRRTRLAATLGVGLMGAASLSTAVYQTISQSSTTVAMPGAVTELDTPLPWGAPAAAAGRVRDLLADDHADRRRPRPALRAAAPGAAPGVRGARSRRARSRCVGPAPGGRRSRRSVAGGPERGWRWRASDVRDLHEQRGAVDLDRDGLAVLLAVVLVRPRPRRAASRRPSRRPRRARPPSETPSETPTSSSPASEAPSSGTATSPSGDGDG